MSNKPAVSLAAVPGRRRAILELAGEIERRGFSGIYCPSMGDGLALCEGIALSTREIPFGTSITPIYTRHPGEFAQTAAFINEIAPGRFTFGLGVSHAPMMARLGVDTRHPLRDMRQFISDLKATPRVGELPRLVLAALRPKMMALAEAEADGLVFANVARSYTATALNVLSQDARTNADFYIGNMIPTCVSNDIKAAEAVNRRTLTSYAYLPNYRNYWRDAGYSEEMDAVEAAIDAGDKDSVSEALSDRWLADTTLFGPAEQIREGLEAWYDAGIKTPILVPSSAVGNQLQAFQEIFALWD